MARPRTIVFTAAGLLLLLLLIFLGAVGAITQTDRGRELLRGAALPLVRAAIPGTLYVGRIGGTLFTDITIDSINLRAPDGTALLATGPVRLVYDPRDLLDRRIIIRYAEIERPVVQLVDYGNNDWNWKRALRRNDRGPSAARRASGFGDWIRLDSLIIRDGALALVEPWRPADSLGGARRDSAIAFNLARRDLEVRRDSSRYTKTRRWMRSFLALGPSRIAHPDSAGLRLAVRRFDAVESDPPFWLRDVAATIRIVQDSLWLDDGIIHLARSGGTMAGKIVWGGGLPMRWDLKIRGDSVAFSDIAWIDPVLPQVGGGSTDLHIRNSTTNVRVMEYVITNMDARALRSQLSGRMTFAVGDTVLRISNVAMSLDPAHTDLLRWMNAEPFPYDWQGALSGRVTARGGPVTRFQLDEAQLVYDDEHVPGARSRLRLSGPLNVYEPALTVFLGTRLEIESLDLRTPRFVNPLFAELNGFIAGSMTLDSVWLDSRFSGADLLHYDGLGDSSRVTGDGRVLLLDNGTYFDVTMAAAPISLTAMSRSYPTMPLRGFVVGPIRARGTVEDFSLETALAGAGGEIAFNGTMDAFEPDFRATGRLRVAGGDVRALFADTLLPPSFLGFGADVDVRLTTLADITGTVLAELSERTSRVGNIPVYTGTLGVTFADARARIDTLSVESAAFRMTASGALGLTAAMRDTVRMRVDADSLGGLRELIRIADGMSGTLGDQAARDSLLATPTNGSLTLRATIAASLDTLDTLGVYAELDGSVRDVIVGTTSAGSIALSASVHDLFRSAKGSGTLTLDSARVAGILLESALADATFADGLPAAFSLSMRAPNTATIEVAGGAVRVADSVRVKVTQFAVRAPADAAARSRQALVQLDRSGFDLMQPAVLTLGAESAVRVDTIQWRHTNGGEIAGSGAILMDGRVRGAFTATAVPLYDLGTLFRPSLAWEGSFGSGLTISGTRDAPVMQGTVALREAKIGSIRYGHLDAAARYQDELLATDLAMRVDDREALTLSASLPVDLSLRVRRERLLDAPLTGRITSRAVDLGLLEAIVPELQGGVGTLDTDISLAGTWERPRLTGGLRIDGGALSLASLGTRLEQLSADIRLASDTVDIRRLIARSGPARSDTLSMSGTVLIGSLADPVFDLRLFAHQFQVIDKARVATLAVSTVVPVTLVGPQQRALLSGALRVDRGRVFLNALSQRRGLDLSEDFNLIDTTATPVDALLATAPTSLVQGLTLQNVRLDIGDDVWIRSPEANIKLGGGLRLTRAVDPRDGVATLALSDSLTVERGTYQLNLGLARPTFDVERGTIRFFGDPEIDPALDIEALHVVRQQRLNSNRQDVRIRVRMGGTLAQPTMTLSSADNPPVPESDMLSYLVTGEPAYALFGTPYAEQGATLALRFAGSYLSSRLAGGRFDLVQVEPTALNPGEATDLRRSGLGILAATRVGVGGQVGERTFLSVTTGLCGLAPQGSGSVDPLSLFAQGLGVKLERQFANRFSAALGVEPGSSAQSCGRPGASRTFQQTPPQIGIDFFRSWSWK